MCLAEQVPLCSSCFISCAYFGVKCLLDVCWVFWRVILWLQPLNLWPLKNVGQLSASIYHWSVCGELKQLFWMRIQAVDLLWCLIVSVKKRMIEFVFCWMTVFSTRRIIIQIYTQNSLKAVWLLCAMADLIDLKGLNIRSL